MSTVALADDALGSSRGERDETRGGVVPRAPKPPLAVAGRGGVGELGKARAVGELGKARDDGDRLPPPPLAPPAAEAADEEVEGEASAL